MAQYNQYQNTSPRTCNSENCKNCPRKSSCDQYLCYVLEKCADEPRHCTDIEITEILQAIKDSENKIIESVTDKISVLDNRFDSLMLDFENVKNQVSAQCEEINKKLDGIIAGFTVVDSNVSTDAVGYNGDTQTGLALYNGGTAPLQKGDVYLEEKKTIFGNTKVVEKTVK